MEDKSNNPGCLGFIVKILEFLKLPEKGKEYTFVKNERLLTPAELSFFHVLQQVFPDEYKIFAKVRIADIVTTKGKSWRSGFGRISQKHVDFVITDHKTCTILLGIELDDSSHQNASAKKGDETKNEAFKEAGIPLLRIRAAHTYHVGDLKKLVGEAWA